jgi:Na+-transporting NADH:ubiquinone oxidoreductase subunit A
MCLKFDMIKLSRGLDIKLKGSADTKYFNVDEPGCYAIMPSDYIGIVPRILVKVDTAVEAGQCLCEDEIHPAIKIVSPVSGIISRIDLDDERQPFRIVIEKSEGEQTFVEFGQQDVDTLSHDELLSLLLSSGLFAFIRQRPYDIVADPSVTPRAIFISAFDTNPLAPDYEFILRGEEVNFQTGLNVLSKIADTHLSINVNQHARALTEAQNVSIHVFNGPHPAGNVGVQLNHIAPVNKGETVWTVGLQTVIYIGKLMNLGHVDFMHWVALTGSEVIDPSYCLLQVGAQLSNVFNDRVTTGKILRYISGNVLTGKQIESDDFIGAYDNQLTVIPEGSETNEKLSWLSLRLKEYSSSHCYFSWLNKKRKYVIDARIKGAQRNIMSADYSKVFPMDILPEFLIKAILADDKQKMEALGIYEVAPEDFALCEFVCPSKLDWQRIVREGLDRMRNEISD